MADDIGQYVSVAKLKSLAAVRGSPVRKFMVAFYDDTEGVMTFEIRSRSVDGVDGKMHTDPTRSSKRWSWRISAKRESPPSLTPER